MASDEHWVDRHLRSLFWSSYIPWLDSKIREELDKRHPDHPGDTLAAQGDSDRVASEGEEDNE